jgi:acetyl-CoA carboxylase biotin carboxylase subunit
VTGKDLVKAQILIADGQPLPYKQEELSQIGHAIECRIYAEDHKKNFMPSPGLIQQIVEPLGQGVRTDGYVYEGYEIPYHYDPMISKLITWAPTRDEAIKRMKRALYEYKITGVKTSIPFLVKIMDTKDFYEGKYDTHFIEKNLDTLLDDSNCDKACEDIALFIAYLEYNDKIKKRNVSDNVETRSQSNGWKEFARRKNVLRF